MAIDDDFDYTIYLSGLEDVSVSNGLISSFALNWYDMLTDSDAVDTMAAEEEDDTRVGCNVAMVDWEHAEGGNEEYTLYYSVQWGDNEDPWVKDNSDETPRSIDSGGTSTYYVGITTTERLALKDDYEQYSEGGGWNESFNDALSYILQYTLSGSTNVGNMMNFKKAKTPGIKYDTVSTFGSTKRTTESLTTATTMITTTDEGSY